MRESVGTQVVGMRSLISCMTRNIPYRIALFIWKYDLIFLYAIVCAFRRRIALVGKIFYWPLLTLSLDPFQVHGVYSETTL